MICRSSALGKSPGRRLGRARGQQSPMLTIRFDGVAAREGGAEEPVYRFDIRVQGDPETVFFAI